MSANQAAVHSAVAHNFGTDYRRYVHRDCIDVDMEPGCWVLHLEFVVVAHSDHVLKDQPSLPVVGACGHSNMVTYTFFLCCRWYSVLYSPRQVSVDSWWTPSGFHVVYMESH